MAHDFNQYRPLLKGLDLTEKEEQMLFDALYGVLQKVVDNVIRVFYDEGISGSLIKRPGMQQMLELLMEAQEAMAVIIDDISRLARGMDTHIELRAAVKLVGAVLESPNMEFGDEPEQQFHENIMASLAQLQRQQNAKTVKNRMKARLQNGYWTFRHFPPGYKFDSHPIHKRILVLDYPLAKVVKEGLDGYANGRFATKEELRRFFLKHSVFPKSKGGNIHNDRINNMLSSPLYAGYVAHKEWGIELTKAKHDALISLMTYQKIQERLAGNPIVAGRYKDNEDFPLREFVVCDDCDRPMTASWSKGRSSRYPYYHCNTRNCKGKNVRRDVMEMGFRQLLKKAKPSTQILTLAKAMIGDIFKKRQQSHSKAKMAIKKIYPTLRRGGKTS